MGSDKKDIYLFETFSGIGAQHKALTNLQNNNILSYELVGTSDWFISAVLAYKAIHFPNTKKLNPTESELKEFFREGVFSNDSKKPVRLEYLLRKDIKDQKEIYQAFKDTNNIGTIVDSFEKYKKLDKKPNLITYSFPCQDLSTAGNFHGFNKGIQEGTRSGLLLEIEHLLEDIKNDNSETLPKFLLLENVPNLVSKQHKKSFDKWLEYLSSIGYSTYWSILDSHKYGFVQRRRRVFALSVKDGKGIIENSLEQKIDNIYDSGNYKPKKQTTKNIFDLENKDTEESIWALMKNTPSRVRMANVAKEVTKNTVKVPTVTTKQDRLPNTGKIAYDHDVEGYLPWRFLSPSETYQLMGFSKQDYKRAKKAVKSKEKLWLHAGNSITVNVIELVFYYIKELLDNE